MSLFDLKGRVALVTGGNGGIGLGMARGLAEAGADVVVAGRQAAKSEAAAAELARLGVRTAVVEVNVADEASARAMVTETVQRMGRLDILVNNAGIRPEAPFEEITLEDWRAVMAVSLEGPFLCAQAALGALEKSKGTIVNIGGLTAYTGAVHRAHVISAKAGLDGLTKALALELAEKGITVNMVAPGMIETVREGAEPAHRKTRTTILGRRGKPEDVSAMVRYLAGPKGRYLTGQTIHVNGGVYLP
jgi:3-oxoacyl-[acyl-carrier protein] reductase